MDQKKIGKFIASCRKENGYTQATLAEKLGITDRAVSKWENGKSMPDASIMLELCELLKINVDELLNGEHILIDNLKETEVSDKNMVSEDKKAGLTKRGKVFLALRLCEKISVKTKTAVKNDVYRISPNRLIHFLQYIPNTVLCQDSIANYPDAMERSGIKSG